MEQNKNPQINTCICNQLIFDNCAKNILRRKESIWQIMFGKINFQLQKCELWAFSSQPSSISFQGNISLASVKLKVTDT